MPKKQLFIGICLIVLVSCITIIFTTFKNGGETATNIENVFMHEKHEKIYTEAQDLAIDSDLVVKVTATDKSINHMETTEDGLPLYYWTENEFIIEDVFVNNVNEQSKRIVVIEPYAIFNNNQRIISEGYTPTETGNEYIFYLVKKAGEEVYLPISTYQAKVDLNESSIKMQLDTHIEDVKDKIKQSTLSLFSVE